MNFYYEKYRYFYNLQQQQAIQKIFIVILLNFSYFCLKHILIIYFLCLKIFNKSFNLLKDNSYKMEVVNTKKLRLYIYNKLSSKIFYLNHTFNLLYFLKIKYFHIYIYLFPIMNTRLLMLLLGIMNKF